MSESTSESTHDRIEARAAADPAVRMFILAGMLLAYSVWCFLDWKPTPTAWDLEHANEVGSFLVTNVLVFLTLPGGLVVLAWALLFLRRRLIADAEGIGYAGKDKIPWHTITKVDASDLASKGILDVYHGEGGKRKLRLDSWKLKDFKPLVAFIESHLPSQVLAESGMGGKDESSQQQGDSGE
ncbi:MAG: hypothetical protein ACLFVW_04150 [Phycisphaerae bacterium]